MSFLLSNTLSILSFELHNKMWRYKSILVDKGHTSEEKLTDKYSLLA
jgi:hypothetical protein